VSESRELTRISEMKMDEMVGGWKKNCIRSFTTYTLCQVNQNSQVKDEMGKAYSIHRERRYRILM
jgi:invasion protein IalB